MIRCAVHGSSNNFAFRPPASQRSMVTVEANEDSNAMLTEFFWVVGGTIFAPMRVD